MSSNLLHHQIFNTNLTTIDHITRFNKTPFVKGESVSQHTFWVILFARLISSHILKKPDFQFILMCVDAATVHDLIDENITGDILFDFKHNELNGDKVIELIDEFVNDQFYKDYPKGQGVLCDYLHQAKEQNEKKVIKVIIKVADWLACLKYEKQELDFGNKAFKPILIKSLKKYDKVIIKFKLEIRSYFKDAVDEDFLAQFDELLTFEHFINE